MDAIVCKWMYAIARFGWPPPWQATPKAFAEMREMGFEWTELEGLGQENLKQLIEKQEQLGRWLTEADLKLATLALILPGVISTDSTTRQQSLELFEQGAQTAAALGAPSVYIDAFTFDCHVFGGDEEAGELSYGQQIPAYLPSSDFDWPQFWDHYVGCIAKCSAIARACGLSLLLEPRIGEIVSNSDGALALAEAVGDSNFGLIFDVAHLHAQKENLAVSVAKLHRHIKYVDVSDNDGCRNRHLVPGDGLVDWDGLFDSLVLYGVEAPLAVDLEKLNDVQGSFRRTLDFLGKVTTRTNKIKQES